MASGDIKAPLLIWVIGATVIFVGFFQLSTGLNLWLSQLEHSETRVLFSSSKFLIKFCIGVYLIAAGIAVAFISTAGRILIVFGAGAGIVLSFLKHNWLGFILNVNSTYCKPSAPVVNIVLQLAVCLAVVLYLLMSPKVAGAFRIEKLRRRRRYEEESIF